MNWLDTKTKSILWKQASYFITKGTAQSLLCLCMCSCSTTTEIAAPDPFAKFMVNPYGRVPEKAVRIDTQKGNAQEKSLTLDNFKEVTIGQGSGRDGFDTLRIFADGKVSAAYSKSHHNFTNREVSFTLNQKDLTNLITTLNQDKACEISGLYSAGGYDGYQGFIEVKTTSGRVYCWLDNHFFPLSQTFDFCNKTIWPRVKTGKLSKRSIDRQADYDRIFISNE